MTTAEQTGRAAAHAPRASGGGGGAPRIASHRGDVHRWSRTLIPTSKEAPSDAEAPAEGGKTP